VRPSFLRFLAGVFLILLPALASAGPDDLTPAELARWEAAAGGHHSFHDLGSGFYVDLIMRDVKDARMAFFNYRLAERLGLKVPKDPKVLEALMKSLFAVEIDPTGTGGRKMMATRYQDSSSKKPGSALGDGRAVWSGELGIEVGDGHRLSVDFVIKGVGQTPLAWTNNDAAHSDGRVKLRELVRSAITSRANDLNELDSTDDLVGFVVKSADGKEARAITVRAGNQTRIAHFRYFSDQPAGFRKLFNYVVARDLGLAPGAEVGATEVRRYFEFFIENIAEEAARYDDLEAIHGSPTAGNRTTKGSTIDLMEFWYHDANHQNFSYLFDKVRREEQISMLRDYARYILGYMRSARYPIPTGLSDDWIRKRFDRVFEDSAALLALHRLGLGEAEIAALPDAVRKRFYRAVQDLRTAIGTENRRIFWQDIKPAAFDLRSVFSSTFAQHDAPDREKTIFANTRGWATPSAKEHDPLKTAYLAATDEIVSLLSTDKKPKAEWIAQAKKANSTLRMEPGTGMPATVDDPFFRAHEERILKALESGEFDFQEIDAWIDRAAQDVVDHGLPHRGVTNLGFSPGFPRFHVGDLAKQCAALFTRF